MATGKRDSRDRNNDQRWQRRHPKHRGGKDKSSFEVSIQRLTLGGVEEADDDAEVVGRLFGAQVTVRRDRKGSRFRWSIAAKHTGIPEDLALIGEGGLASLTEVVRGDFLTGDKTFDDAVVVRGTEAVALALLSESVRKRARRWISDGAVLSKGTVSWSGELADDSGLLTVARSLGQLASDLSLAGQSVHRRLIANAQKDPIREVRARNLRALATEGSAALANRKLVPIINEVAGSGAPRLSDLARPVVVALVSGAPQLLTRLTQSSLLLLLENDNHRLAALERLAAKGDQFAVAEISRVTTGLLASKELKEAGRRTIARILERTGGEAVGGLSEGIS